MDILDGTSQADLSSPCHVLWQFDFTNQKMENIMNTEILIELGVASEETKGCVAPEETENELIIDFRDGQPPNC